MENEEIPVWQLALAIFGFLLWMFLLSAIELIEAQGWKVVYEFVSGYSFGYIVAFSGLLFWEVIKGRGRRFLDPHPVFGWLSYFVLGMVFLFGLAGLAIEVFGYTNWPYNIGSLMAGVAVGIGLAPVIDKYDKLQP
ncbi:hypothetical protein [Thiosocius teredinicola]|uniref:hypothetical protein n=1 Tax=Thiosocius teredinicola TaxID=1973002 RepID=UPI000990ED1F